MLAALLDTCVLVPSRARDVLLEIGSAGAYQPLWSAEILKELDRTLRTLLNKRGVPQEEIDAYLMRLFRMMRIAFPDALVSDWESLVSAIQLPDLDDRHVVAAARAGRADVIVTDNLIHFPPSALPPWLSRQSLDDFLLDVLDTNRRQVLAAIQAVAGRTGKTGPPMTSRDVASYLATHGMPGFGERLIESLSQLLSVYRWFQKSRCSVTRPSGRKRSSDTPARSSVPPSASRVCAVQWTAA